MFPDDYFFDLYSESANGRPTIPARVMATVMVLQAFEGLSDREATDRLEVDLRWQAASGVDTANLLQRLDTYVDDVLRFATDFRVSFDNYEAERQVRMVKVQQKISGGFRTKAGATAWLAVRSYLATVMKNGENPLGALRRLMVADPWMPPVADSG
jgi:hypothetical protein